MNDVRFVAPLKDGGSPSVSPGIGAVDPPGIRAKLMLETASHMMTEFNWPYRETTLEMTSQGDEIGSFRLFGANNPGSIRRVFEREVDISIMNPAVILSMAHRGIGVFSKPMQVALIAMIPHDDQLGFAVTASSGLTSLDDIREKRFPLRLSVRGSMDACTTLLVDKVLNVHGFGYEDVLSWGGCISYDQPMPSQPSHGKPSRVERVRNGELDAIFEEGVVVWANQAVESGMRFLSFDKDRLRALEHEGFKRGTMEKARLKALPSDVGTVDFSGWPIYSRVDTPDLLIRKFCEALDARKDAIPWHFGPAHQPDLPLRHMVVDAPGTPIDIPFHPVAREFWVEKGYTPA